MMQRWLWLLVLVATGWSGVTYLLNGPAWIGWVMLTVGLALSWWVSPYKGGRSVRHEDVMARPSAQRPVVIYWRPGCTFCARLTRSLGPRRSEAIWVNIWQDADAATFVRSVNDGNETVPTVLIDGIPVTNPDPKLVRDRLTSI